MTKALDMQLSNKDEQLINLLRQDARLSTSEIARRLSSSRTATQMRLQKLERNGVIDGYTVKLSSEYAEKQIRALVMIKFSPKNREKIEASLHNIAQLTTLYSISGAFDMAAIVSAHTMRKLDNLIDKIGCLEGIDATMSSIILSTKINREDVGHGPAGSVAKFF